MNKALAFVLSVFFASASVAGDAAELPLEGLLVPPDSHDISKFLWTNRLIVVFADSENDPRMAEQMRLLAERPEALAERDILVLTDTTPAESSPLREKFRPRGFMMLLIGKDGQVYLRKPHPWNLREISRSVDKIPLRQQEIRERR